VSVVRFERYLKDLMTRAADEARAQGSATVESQHLLLAIAAEAAGSPGRDALAAVGLDHDAVRAALDREFAASLATVGISPSSFGLPPATPDPHEQPRLGASVQLTLDRALRSATGTRPQPAHVLLGILAAEVGTVPRALSLARVDRAALIQHLTASAARHDD
jgi:ATP-dependent Clp protease ATP-binding subunit ClpA